MAFSFNYIIKATDTTLRVMTTAPLDSDLFRRDVADTINQIAQYGLMPVGSVVLYAGTASQPVPARHGWLLLDGAAVSRAQFSQLFALIGTTYGAGDGSTTFNLPDTRGLTLAAAANPPAVQIDAGGGATVEGSTPPPLPEVGEVGGSGAAIVTGGRPDRRVDIP
jgi:hypothetical protein